MEQVFQFDTIYSRISGNCKWDGVGDVLPMSVADMDFASPPCVVSALQERAAKGLFGYQVLTERDYTAIIDWRMRRHGEVLRREWLLVTPGVLNTMRAAVYALTNPGDCVIVQTPLHTPSISSASMRGRTCLDVPMRIDGDGRYVMDYEGLERAFASGARVMTLCSPSNPTGRVWTYEELERLARLVEKYDAYVIADEIHADIIYGGRKHISLRTLPGMGKRVISTFSPSKSFNFGGFHIATAVIEDDDLRKRISDLLYEMGIVCGRPGAMEITAQTAVYTQGDAWLDALLVSGWKYLHRSGGAEGYTVQGIQAGGVDPDVDRLQRHGMGYGGLSSGDASGRYSAGSGSLLLYGQIQDRQLQRHAEPFPAEHRYTAQYP